MSSFISSKTFDLLSNLSDNNFQTENLRVIAFITDSENLTINSQHASVGEFQDFN